tara:strand:+ start:769 stop:942 length:174 start_codon:yes stop_codon:yes gene_type:complete
VIPHYGKYIRFIDSAPFGYSITEVGEYFGAIIFEMDKIFLIVESTFFFKPYWMGKMM